VRYTIPTFILLALAGWGLGTEPAAAKKDHPDGTVSVIRDGRIAESSALALSVKYDDLVYTVNDRGNRPMIFAVQLSTGEVVGTTDVSSLSVEDTESLAVDAGGTLWLGDLGDNDHNRDDVSIISFPEPGPGDHHLSSAERYPVSLPDGPVDIEGMLIQPQTDRVRLVTKNRNGLGTIYDLPPLAAGATAEAKDAGVDAPEAVTDATYTSDGRWALLRTNDDVWVYDTKTWKPVRRLEGPDLAQGESIAVEPGDRSVLLGSEGKNSPIVRMPLPKHLGADGPITLVDESATKIEPVPAIGVLLAGLLVAAVVVIRRNRVRGGRT
jgi:hypothetical protein